MKTTLTPEESANLIKLGIGPNLASKEVNHEPVFTLTDILSFLPPITKELGGIIFVFSIERGWGGGFDSKTDSHQYEEEFLDVLYELIVWYLKNKKKKICVKL